MSAEWASLGAALGLTLDLDTAAYAELRAEFLAMTAAARRASGLSTAVVVTRCAGRPGKQTVYNYAGGSGYLSFPKPDLLQRYLESCDLPADQVRFAVDRCAQIRRKHPEAGKPGPRKVQQPLIEERGAAGLERSAGTDLPGGSRLPSIDVPGDGDLPHADVPSVRDLPHTDVPSVRGLPHADLPSVRGLPGVGLPLSAQSGGWAGRWRGLVRLVAPRKIVAAVDGAGEPRFVTPLPSTWYGSRAAEPWQPSRHAPTGAPSHDGADRRWVGSELRDSGVRVTPGRLALRIVRAELENAWPQDECNAMGLVRKAYGTLGIALHTRAGEESGVPVPLEQAAPGDILTLVDGRKGLYAGGGWALLLAPAVDGANLHGIRHDQVATAHRINWESVPLTSRPLGWGGVWPNVDWVVLSGRPAPMSSVSIAPVAADAVPRYADVGQRQADGGHGPALTVAAGELPISTEAIVARDGPADGGHGPASTVAAGELPTWTEATLARCGQADRRHRPGSTVATGELPISTEAIVGRYGEADGGHGPASTVAAGELPISTEAIVARYGEADGGHLPALTVAAGELPASTEAVVARYEQLVHAVSEQVEAAGQAAEPGLAALRAIDGLAFPHMGAQAWLIREAFKAVDLPLPERIRFELPIMAVALRHLDLCPGDIVFTESGVLGFYGEQGELIYLGPAGTPATSALPPALYAAAWRVTAVPAHSGYGLTSKVEMVEHDGAGRLVRIYRAGERRSGRHRRCPETREVVAMVIKAIERAQECAVPVSLTGQQLFTAAVVRGGAEFSSPVTEWDPVHEPAYPRDTRLTTVQAALPGSSATAAQQLMARLATAPASRWSRRPRPGVA
ncbi:hypothetical protein AB0M22_18445 [Nocardia sp. NPDC051756]|uniref:hypothetical protein n=1 Tax=Nocardia sp. NPDC051756 TaxID=3154751 RepID=UPI003441D8D6